MKYALISVTLLGLAACGGAKTGNTPQIISDPDANRTPPPVTLENDATFGQMLNAVRARNGVAPVTYDSRLDAAAQVHADDMVNRGYFAHDADGNDRDGVETNMVGDRVTAQGYNWTAVGENLAGGQRTESAALTAWENSPAHDRMMNAPTLEEFGVAVAGSGNGTRWVLVMGTEAR